MKCSKKLPSEVPDSNKVASFLAGFIGLYQKFVSPLFRPKCRFYPSCSQYAKECLMRFGVCKGGYLAARRCLKCHPCHPGGFDPVPDASDSKTLAQPDAKCQPQHR